MTANVKILVIHGAGEGSYEYDEPLANFVRGQLDDPMQLAYPKFEGLERGDWSQIQQELTAALSNLADDGQIIGHSLGGAAILKLLSEQNHPRRINGLFLVAIPYICKDGEWAMEDLSVDNDFADHLPDCGDIRLYHSRDDDIVPFNHVHLYAEKLKQATVTVVDGHGHQFASKPFLELAKDLKQLLANKGAQK